MDLFTPQIEQDKMHHNFIEMTKEKYPYARDLLTEWADCFIDRDKKFVKEFQSSFNITIYFNNRNDIKLIKGKSLINHILPAFNMKDNTEIKNF